MIRLVEMIHTQDRSSRPKPATRCSTTCGIARTSGSRKLLPPGVKVAHKTGSVAAVRTDAGLIEAKSGPIAICVLTRNNKDQRWTDENAARSADVKNRPRSL